jgi:hypothetical protein
MRLSACVVAAIALFAVTLPSAADEGDGWYIYWGDNLILGGPYPSEEICKTAMRTKSHIPSDAVCEVIIYHNGVPQPGTQDDLNPPPSHPKP